MKFSRLICNILKRDSVIILLVIYLSLVDLKSVDSFSIRNKLSSSSETFATAENNNSKKTIKENKESNFMSEKNNSKEKLLFKSLSLESAEMFNTFFNTNLFSASNELSFKNKETNNSRKISKTRNTSSNTTQALLKESMSRSYTKFKSIKTDFTEMKMSAKLLQDIRARKQISSLYTYINDNNTLYLAENEIESSSKAKSKLLSKSEYSKKRFSTGWDELKINTYGTSNPLIQCWSAGFSEGLLTFEEISYYYNNIQVFFHENLKRADEIKGLYSKIHNKLENRIKNFDLDDFSFETSTNSIKKWAYQACILAQLEGIKAGYNSISDKKLTIADFYFINAEGNFGDMKEYLKVNKLKDFGKNYNSKENLKLIYNTDNIKEIWKNITKNGHCSALVKLLKNNTSKKYDVLLGHNTWTDYSEMLRTLKTYNFEFEGKLETPNNLENSIEMKTNTIKFSSYPGVLFSGDDFYIINNKIAIAQTTLSALNKFIYKDLLDLEYYVPEFIRIMTTNYISESAIEWYLNFKDYRHHMYVTQWIVIDYSVLNKINEQLSTDIISIADVQKKHPYLILLIEDVPTSIKGIDLTQYLFDKGYFGSFNMSYFPEHQKILGLTSIESQIDIFSKENNPRYYLFNQLVNNITDIESFSKVILYNGYKNSNSSIKDDPSFNDSSNGISSRDDLGRETNLHGGVDFKVSYIIINYLY